MTPARWTVLLLPLFACVLAAGPASAEGPDCVNPPKGQMGLEGPHIQVGDAVWAGPTARVVVRWVDSKTGGPAMQAISSSREELDAYATRRNALPKLEICGDAWEVHPLVFTVDATPPNITWEVVDLDDFPNERRKARKPKGLSWSGGASWKPLEESAEPLRIRTDTPQLLLHGASFDLGDTDVRPDDDQMLRVRFQDDGAGVDHLSFRLRSGTDGRMVLEIETADLVGNARKVEWSLTDAKAARSGR